MSQKFTGLKPGTNFSRHLSMNLSKNDSIVFRKFFQPE